VTGQSDSAGNLPRNADQELDLSVGHETGMPQQRRVLRHHSPRCPFVKLFRVEYNRVAPGITSDLELLKAGSIARLFALLLVLLCLANAKAEKRSARECRETTRSERHVFSAIIPADSNEGPYRFPLRR
jgi:hypothetical protein